MLQNTVKYYSKNQQSDKRMLQNTVKYYSKNLLSDKRMLATHKHETVHEPEAE